MTTSCWRHAFVEQRAAKRQKTSKRGKSLARDEKRHRDPSAAPKEGEGYKDLPQKLTARKMMKRMQKSLGRKGRAGEADRRERASIPKHLVAGKMGKGTSRSR